MTSINAMRFDAYSGVLVCDEARSWGDDRMIFYTSEKIRPVIKPDIQRELGIVVCQGNTGTSTLGDEFIEAVKQRISDEYDKETKRLGKKPKKFKKIEDLAHMAFEVITQLKHKHIDQSLVGKFGFTSNQYVNGSYKKDDQVIEIKDKEIAGTAHKYLTWDGRIEEVTAVFLNAQVFAGYEPEGGFRIFLLSEILPVCEAVHSIYLAEGSGLDTCDLMYTAYADMKSIPERRGSIDRVEGLVAMIEGINTACKLSAGVGGYLKIIYINGHETDHMKRYKEIADKRAKLASEIVSAYTYRLMPRETAFELVEDIIYNDREFAEVDEAMWKSTPNPKKLIRFFRGYRQSIV